MCRFKPLRIVTKILYGTEKRTRTSTEFPPLAPEASVSTNSTTSAFRATLHRLLYFVNAVSRFWDS
jgi:hypothetical protein